MKKVIKILIILVLLSSCILFTQCGSKYFTLDPNISYLEQFGNIIYICRIDFKGDPICETTLDFYGDNKLLVTPLKSWIIDGR